MSTASPPTAVHWRFVCQKRNGTTYLHFLELCPEDTGSIVMSKLRDEYFRVKSRYPYQLWDRLSILRMLTVEEASLSEVSLLSLIHAC